MTGEKEKRIYPRNPIGIIALFVFFIEAISTVSLKFLLDAQSEYVGIIVGFIVTFPSVIAVLFFVTIWFRRESLYSPGDFREDINFLKLIHKVKALEIRQEAAQQDPRGDTNAALSIIKRLIEINEFDTAIHLGQSFLKVKRFSSSLEIFNYLRDTIPENDSFHSKAKEYYAYSLIGLERFSEAIDELQQLNQKFPNKFGFWPSLALANAYMHIGEEERSKYWIDCAKNLKDTPDLLPLVKDMYPKLARWLESEMNEHANRGDEK